MMMRHEISGTISYKRTAQSRGNQKIEKKCKTNIYLIKEERELTGEHKKGQSFTVRVEVRRLCD